MSSPTKPIVFLSANSADYDVADQVYEALVRHGIDVFFSFRSLPDLGNSDYRRVIDSKLDECVHMVVVGRSRAHLESPWVEAEWGFFINAKRAGSKGGNIVTVVADGLSPDMLPPSLRYYEALPLKPATLQRIVRYLVPPLGESETPGEPVATIESAPPTATRAPRGRLFDDAEGVWAAHVKVVGVGGAGLAVLEKVVAQLEAGIKTAVISTDVNLLRPCKADSKIVIGSNIPKGLGSGADPSSAEKAAEEDIELIRNEVSGGDLLLLCTGLGGGTGTGATPVVAREARAAGVLTICLATLPFQFEGVSRRRNAARALELLREHCDLVIPIPSDDALTSLAGDAPFGQAFDEMARLQGSWLTALTRLFLHQGMINLDFADLANVFRRAGLGAVGQGEASGPDRAYIAARKALTTQFFSDLDIRAAKSIVLQLEGNAALGLQECAQATNAVTEICGEEVNIVFNSSTVDSVEDKVRVTIFATHFRDDRALLSKQSE